jgi:hypothetical protein
MARSCASLRTLERAVTEPVAPTQRLANPIPYIVVGVVPFPLAIWLLPMADGLSGFLVLCVPFAVGAAATYRGYRRTGSAIARGVLLTLGLFYAIVVLFAALVLAAQLLRR